MPDLYLPCNTPGCKNTPHKTKASTARALYEYRLLNDPNYVFRLSCDWCGKPSTYPYEQVIGLIPVDDRPKPLPHDHFWAFMLYELDAWKNKDYRAYLGDRVLVQRLTSEPTGIWYGILRSTSPYAPSLAVGNYIKGRPRGSYELCLDVIEGSDTKPIPRPPQIPKAISFGLFVSPRKNEKEMQCANLFCSNPSCHYIYSTMTFTKFSGLIAREQLDEGSFDEETFQPTIRLECPVCRTERIIDEASFDGLYKERE